MVEVLSAVPGKKRPRDPSDDLILVLSHDALHVAASSLALRECFAQSHDSIAIPLLALYNSLFFFSPPMAHIWFGHWELLIFLPTLQKHFDTSRLHGFLLILDRFNTLFHIRKVQKSMSSPRPVKVPPCPCQGRLTWALASDHYATLVHGELFLLWRLPIRHFLLSCHVIMQSLFFTSSLIKK